MVQAIIVYMDGLRYGSKASDPSSDSEGTRLSGWQMFWDKLINYNFCDLLFRRHCASFVLLGWFANNTVLLRKG